MRRNHVDVGVTAAVAALSLSSTLVPLPTLVLAPLGIALFASAGYVWAKVILRRDVSGLEGVSVATGLALAAPVLGGLALQFAGVPLHRVAWTSLIAAVTLAADAVLLTRHHTLRPTVPRRDPIEFSLSAWHVFTFAVAIVLAASAVALASFGAATQHYPGFTQLWLSPRGTTMTANLGVSNHQGGIRHYRLILVAKGRINNSWNLTLSNDESWQRTISISAAYATAANLYLLPDLSHPYRHVSTATPGIP